MHKELSMAVQRGAEWLDQNHSGWWQKINLLTLRLNQCDTCVLGQLLGDYHHALSQIVGRNTSFQHRYSWSDQHGFSVNYALDCTADEANAAYAILTDRWRWEIAARQQLVPAA